MDKAKITGLGWQGDGIGQTENGDQCFVPFSLPGDVLNVSGEGKRKQIEAIVAPSETRKAALCKHHGICGGCQLQHFEDGAYRSWKTDLVKDALSREGIEVPELELISFDVSSRRKAVFSAHRIDSQLKLGFVEANSQTLLDLEMCPVLVPALENALPDIRNFAASLPLGKKALHISVLSTQNGLDVTVSGAKPPNDAQKNGYTRKALELGFARLSFNDEVIIEDRKPYLKMGKASVVPPPAAFVQASAEAEARMVEVVSSHLRQCKNVADLYCGIGTFALRLAENSPVLAVEEHEAAINALDIAWRKTGGALKQLKTECRNLERRPLTFKELKHIDGLVFDPPRAGAELQAKQIAKSKVRKIAAVSCNPKTLAVDLSILLEGGYKIQHIEAVDQFRFTPHIEVVVLLEK